MFYIYILLFADFKAFIIKYSTVYALINKIVQNKLTAKPDLIINLIWLLTN